MKALYLFIVLCLLSGMVFAQAPVPDPNHQKIVQFTQGDDLLDEGMFEWFEQMKDYAYQHQIPFVFEAQALAAIFMLIFFSIKSYEMMVGDKKIEIMPLLRPFALVMITIWWTVFCRIIAFPTEIVAKKTKALYNETRIETNSLRLIRGSYIIQLSDKMVDYNAETELAAAKAEEADKSLIDQAIDGTKGFFSDQILKPLLKMRIRMQTSFSLLITQILDLTALWIFRIATYLIFIFQIIYSSVLVVLGPFAVAMSILPAYRDALVTWIARFVSVNLYSGIAYLILYIISLLVQYAMQAEVDRYAELLTTSPTVDTLEKIAWLTTNGYLSFGIVLVTFVVGAIGILTVPSISTWIISTSGVSSAATQGGRAGGSMARAGKVVLTKGVMK